MVATSWSIQGQYYETCSCNFICPCITGQMVVEPSKGTCTFAMAFQIQRGSFASTGLDGLNFIVLGFTPEAMAKGNWSVGLLVDERATPAQRDAITAIASGNAGGPMAMLSGLVGNLAGIASSPIQIEREGHRWSVVAPGFVDIAATAAMGLDPEAVEPMHLDNTGHPANDRVALARPARSHVRAFGLSWNDQSGQNSGQFAPFSWHSA